MSAHEHDIDEIIGKYLAGEASVEETQTVQEWCAQSAENQKYFEHLQLIFQRASLVNDTSRYDADVAWRKVQTQLHVRRAWFNQPAFRIAASLLLVSVIGVWVYNSNRMESIELMAETSIIEDSLPDGTQVVLNKKTELTVAYNAKQKKGRIKLKGEAKFEIKHEADKELIVEADEVLIRDIGTVFNVKAYAENNTIEVTVQEGEVQFYTPTSEGVFIKAGGKGVYDKLSKTFTIEQADTNVLAYQTRQFVFEEDDLQNVADQLNAIYERKLVIADNLKRCRVTVNFNNEDIETIAEILAETLNLQYTITDATITLEGEGCE